MDNLNPKPNYVGRTISRLRYEQGWTMDEYYLKIAASASAPDEMISYNTMSRALHMPHAWNPREKTLDVLARPFGLPGWILRIEDPQEFDRVRAMLKSPRPQEEPQEEENDEAAAGDFMHRPLRGQPHKL